MSLEGRGEEAGEQLLEAALEAGAEDVEEEDEEEEVRGGEGVSACLPDGACRPPFACDKFLSMSFLIHAGGEGGEDRARLLRPLATRGRVQGPAGERVAAGARAVQLCSQGACVRTGLGGGEERRGPQTGRACCFG